jgi:Family of unknown function (DUF6441)
MVTMPLKFSFAGAAPAWQAAIEAHRQRREKARLAAITAAGDLAKAKGRASIAAAGFSARWQNALRVRIYPDGPAAFVYHKIGYADVFEEGATIAGKPYLWIALPGAVPPSSRRSGHPMSPSEYAERFGELVAVNVPGKAPMLFEKYQRVGDRRGRKAKRAGDQRKPLYVGVPAVTVQKKFDIAAAARAAAAALPRLYDDAVRG